MGVQVPIWVFNIGINKKSLNQNFLMTYNQLTTDHISCFGETYK